MTTSQEVFRRQIRRLILVPLIVSLLIAAVLELQVRRLTSAQEWVEHTDFVIAQSRLLLRSIIDQETGLRGYLLSRDTQFLQPYHSAEASLPRLFDQLRSETADNPDQQNQLEAVRQSYERWHSYAEDGIARAARNDPSVDQAAFNLSGKQLMDEVRGRQQDFVDREDQLRTMRLQRSESAGQAMTWTLLGLVGVFRIDAFERDAQQLTQRGQRIRRHCGRSAKAFR
jgi:CHASE3 domain sensor protein